jgi:hypothetical protein
MPEGRCLTGLSATGWSWLSTGWTAAWLDVEPGREKGRSTENCHRRVPGWLGGTPCDPPPGQGRAGRPLSGGLDGIVAMPEGAVQQRGVAVGGGGPTTVRSCAASCCSSQNVRAGPRKVSVTGLGGASESWGGGACRVRRPTASPQRGCRGRSGPRRVPPRRADQQPSRLAYLWVVEIVQAHIRSPPWRGGVGDRLRRWRQPVGQAPSPPRRRHAGAVRCRRRGSRNGQHGGDVWRTVTGRQGRGWWRPLPACRG